MCQAIIYTAVLTGSLAGAERKTTNGSQFIGWKCLLACSLGWGVWEWAEMLLHSSPTRENIFLLSQWCPIFSGNGCELTWFSSPSERKCQLQKSWREQKLSLLGLHDEFVMTVLTLSSRVLILMSRGTAQHQC